MLFGVPVYVANVFLWVKRRFRAKKSKTTYSCVKHSITSCLRWSRSHPTRKFVPGIRVPRCVSFATNLGLKYKYRFVHASENLGIGNCGIRLHSIEAKRWTFCLYEYITSRYHLNGRNRCCYRRLSWAHHADSFFSADLINNNVFCCILFYSTLI